MKLCRAKPKYTWETVTGADGYLKLPPKDIKAPLHNEHVNCYIYARLKEGLKDCHNIW